MIFNSLINRLHRVFDKAPVNIGVIGVEYNGGTCAVEIKDLRLKTKATYPLDIDLSTITLAELVDAINNVPGYTAALASPEYGQLLARGLYEDGDRAIV